MNIRLFLVFIAVVILAMQNAISQIPRKTFYSDDEWIQTNGPPGGYITDIVIDPKNPDTLYAVGSTLGVYKTVDAGENWVFISFPTPYMVSNIEIDPDNPNILYSNYLNFARSLDGGENWEVATNGFSDVGEVIDFCLDPMDSNILYMIGIRFDGTGFIIYKSIDRGENWFDITNDLYLPFEGILDASISSAGNGRIWITVNIFGEGKVFYTPDDGGSWREVDFGRVEPCWIKEVFVDPFNLNEVWIAESQKIDQSRPYLVLYRSLDGGESWNNIIVNDFPEADRVDFLASSKDGKLFVSFGDAITYTLDGETFIDITPKEPGLWIKKITDIAVDPLDSNKLYLPSRTIGILYSSDGGKHWSRRDNGIIATNSVLMASDPIDPMTIYASGYKTMDGGETWSYLPENGMIYLIEDEWMVDPANHNNIWYAGDVPYVERSRDGGQSWEAVILPERDGVFNFCSIYALTQNRDGSIIYTCNNGYGLYKGLREGDDYNWFFLRNSEVDYTYTIALDSSDPDIIYSGYSCKPFESKTKIRVSYDAGETWFTGLQVDGEAITSIATNYDKTFAVSNGENGASIWVSQDKGESWSKINRYFNLINIHSYTSTSSTVYAGIWGGGIYKTMDKGISWERIPGDETFSAASIAIDPNNDIIYVADRTKPVVYRSIDSGETWDVFFNAGDEYRRMMWVTVDPNGVVYVSAMKTIGPGKFGSIFKIEDDKISDITDVIPRLVLSITVDPEDPSILYAVLHERGVYKSINGGRDWFEISNNSGLPDSGFSNLYINPVDSNILYLIGGCDVRFDTFESAGLDPDIVNGVYISRDAGGHWENINHGVLGRNSGAIKTLVFNEDNPNVIYIGGEHGVYYSIDGGGSWEKSIPPYENIGGLILQGDTIYALTRGAGVILGHINKDYSITWEDKQRLSSPIYFSQLIPDPSNENILYVTGYPGGIFKTIDSGRSWMEMNFGMTSFRVDDPLRQGYYALAISRSNPNVLYVGLYHHGVYKSINGGATWKPIGGSYTRNIGVTCIAVDPLDENIVYIGSEEGVYKTIDGGETWLPFNEGLPTLDVKTISIDDLGGVIIGTRGYGIYKLDYDIWVPLPPMGGWGNPWPIWNRPLYQYTTFLINPEDDKKIMIGTFPQGFYKSDDDGISWRESNVGFLNDGVFSMTYRPDDPNIIYAGTYNGVSRSFDWGEHWEQCSNGWPKEQWVFSIVFNPKDNDIMYACSKNGENQGVGREGFHGIVMKSIDAGDHWYPIVDGLNIDQEFYGLVIDRGNPDILYLATQREGVFISYDAGNHWEPWNDGLKFLSAGNNGNNVAHPLVLSADGKYIYFGTNEMGVFKRKTITGGKHLEYNRLFISMLERLERIIKSIEIYSKSSSRIEELLR